MKLRKSLTIHEIDTELLCANKRTTYRPAAKTCIAHFPVAFHVVPMYFRNKDPDWFQVRKIGQINGLFAQNYTMISIFFFFA